MYDTDGEKSYDFPLAFLFCLVMIVPVWYCSITWTPNIGVERGFHITIDQSFLLGGFHNLLFLAFSAKSTCGATTKSSHGCWHLYKWFIRLYHTPFTFTFTFTFTLLKCLFLNLCIFGSWSPHALSGLGINYVMLYMTIGMPNGYPFEQPYAQTQMGNHVVAVTVVVAVVVGWF